MKSTRTPVTLPGRNQVPEDVGTLVRPPTRWPQRALGCLAAGFVGYGFAPLLGEPTLAGPALVLGVAGAGGTVAAGVRSRRRTEVVDQLAVVLARHQGLRVPTRASLRGSRWTSRWGGVPQRLVISYAPGVNDGDPEWALELRRAVERRLLLPFKQTRLDRRNCRLVLEFDEAHAEQEQAGPHIQRARRVVARNFGTSAAVAVSADGGDAVTRVEVEYNPETSKRVTLTQVQVAIEREFTALLPGRWRARWDLENDKVTFELRPTLPAAVPHVPGAVTDETRYLIPLAVDEDGDVIYWNLRGSGPHLLVVGKTGTGKTVAINGAVMEFTREERDWPVIICDPKRIEFMGLREWPGVQMVATTVIDMVVAIKFAHDLMEDRYSQIERGLADESDFEPLLLVLDEYRNFQRQVDEWWGSIKERGMPRTCPVFGWVAAIAEKGRSGQVHVILGTQRPDSAFLGGDMRDNFDSRLALGRLSPQGSTMMWENPWAGVAVPRRVRGRATAINHDDKVVEAQVLWTPDPRRAYRDNKVKDIELLDALRSSRTKNGRVEVELGPETDLDTGKPFHEWARVYEARLVPVGTATLRPPPVTAHLSEPGPGFDAVADADSRVTERDPGAYAPEKYVSADRLEAGDLVQIDEDLDVWAVVEVVTVDGSAVCIGWRDDDTGEAGDLELEDADRVMMRRPLEDVDDRALDDGDDE